MEYQRIDGLGRVVKVGRVKVINDGESSVSTDKSDLGGNIEFRLNSRGYSICSKEVNPKNDGINTSSVYVKVDVGSRDIAEWENQSM